MTRLIHDCRSASHRRAGEGRQDWWLAENEAAYQFRVIQGQRERDVGSTRVSDEMCRPGFESRDQCSQIGHVNAERLDVRRLRLCVRREETPAVRDNTEARCERLHLWLKGEQRAVHPTNAEFTDEPAVGAVPSKMAGCYGTDSPFTNVATSLCTSGACVMNR